MTQIRLRSHGEMNEYDFETTSTGSVGWPEKAGVGGSIPSLATLPRVAVRPWRRLSEDY